jgi:hypothetical protein
MLSVAVLLAYTAGLTQKHLWYYDSGAGVYIIYTRENISLYIPNNRTLPLIQTVNGVCRLLGSSTVKLQVKGPRGMIWLRLQKVLYIPSTPVNLFSGL